MAILTANPNFATNFATTTNMEGKTALHLLARNPSAFASESRPCEFCFVLFFFVFFFGSYFGKNS